MKIKSTRCGNCGKSFLHYKSEERKYCSHKCANIVSMQMRKDTAERVTFTCLNCGKIFSILASQERVRGKSGKTQYCSVVCYHAAIKVKEKSCLLCEKPFIPPRKKSKYCSVECKNKALIGKKKTGYWYENGYKVLYAGNGKGIKEHILIMETKIGRKLKKNEHVHHKDFNPKNNNEDNLQLMTRGEHSRLHREIEKVSNNNKFGRHRNK